MNSNTCSFDRVTRNNRYDSANAGRSQRALSISTQYLACGLTNHHVEIHGNSLEDSGVRKFNESKSYHHES